MRALGLLLFCLVPTLAVAAEPVDTMLVLVTDVSRSVDDTEFAMEKEGYSAALTNPQVLAAIKGGPIGQIAVAYVEFAGAYEVRTVVDWHVVRDAASATAFGEEVKAAQRSYWGRTSISAGIDHALQMLSKGEFEAQRRVVDVAGDGTNNSGRDVRDARDDAVKAGVTINGLAIVNEHPVNYSFAHVQPPGGLPNWYAENVVGGVGSFVVEVRSFEAFGEAMTRKLLNEIAGTGGRTQHAAR
ncbi:MAG: DUF1194 domain-containing protein [Acetobacteraceae bacterium]|nr:DUF1194 domain-containing protein [Acetobacteraceae bacterium]